MTASPKYDVTFNINSGEKTPSVKVFRGGKIYQPRDEGGAVYALCSGEYSYEVTAEDCITDGCRFATANAAPARAPSARSARSSRRHIAENFHLPTTMVLSSREILLSPIIYIQKIYPDMLAFFPHVRYNINVNYFEVFLLYFINFDIKKVLHGN